MDGYITGSLNSQEKALYNSDKTKALLCMANGKLAITYAQNHYKNTAAVQHNGNGDAFRHALWNYGMVLDVGASFAKKWADAHENGTPNNPALEKEMDLYNNNVGRGLGSSNPSPGSIGKMIDLVKAKVDAGICKIIVNGKLVKSSPVGKL